MPKGREEILVAVAAVMDGSLVVAADQTAEKAVTADSKNLFWECAVMIRMKADMAE
jgi:hypothetical protein